MAVAEGERLVVKVGAVGDGLTYTWYFKNATQSTFRKTDTFKGDTYTIDAMDAVRDGRQIYCVVTDKYGNSVSTDIVTISMVDAVQITKQPENVTVGAGETAKVTFTATGDGLTYKWYYRNAGASKFSYTSSFTGNSYWVKMDATRHGRQVYCVITDKNGNSVQTNTVTLRMESKVQIVTQPQSVFADKDEVATVKVSAAGEGLTYTWYYKDAGASAFKKTDSFKGNTYTVTMSAARSGRQIYCVVTDKYGNSVQTVTVTLTMNKRYTITVHTGDGDPVVAQTDGSGKYTLETPKKVGYVLAGWKTAAGKAFSSSGTIQADVAVYAVWELDGTDTLAELVERINAGCEKIQITGNITVNQPLFISHDITIYSDGDYTLKRDPNYAGDIFVIGQDHKGVSNLLLHRKAVLTLGGGKGTLTIDGNKSKVKVSVVGSVVFITNSGTLNLYDGVQIINNNKVGNARTHEFSAFSSETVRNRAGGAAVLNLNGTVNMYGGVLKGNTVLTQPTAAADGAGSTDISCYGGAIYNRSSIYMYGGTICDSEAYSGGAIYSEAYVTIVAGTISNNAAEKYGGAIASSGSANCNIFIGSERDGGTVTFSGNTSAQAGGAIYSSTDSPIVIYGNTVFSNNTSKTSGGAIYTSGGLTVRGTTFTGNKASKGGAIFHNRSNTELTRRSFAVGDSIFTGNTATDGGAIGLGAADSATKGTYVTIQNCTFKENKASSSDGKSGNGGAIYAT